jgi:hypothetical protein
MWDVLEIIGAFSAAILITYAAIAAVFAVSGGIVGVARRSNRWFRTSWGGLGSPSADR